MRALIATERYHQAIHDPQSFHIHPLNFALALAGDIERRGGECTSAPRRPGWSGRGRPGACGRRAARSRRATSCWPAMPISAGVQPRIARAVLPVATYVAVTAKLGPRLAEIHPLARRDLRHASRRRLLSHRRRRPPAVGRPHHHRHARTATAARADARRHPVGLSRARRRQRSSMPGPASWAMRRT